MTELTKEQLAEIEAKPLTNAELMLIDHIRALEAELAERDEKLGRMAEFNAETYGAIPNPPDGSWRVVATLCERIDAIINGEQA